MFVKFQSHLMDMSTHSSSQCQNIVKNKYFPFIGRKSHSQSMTG